MSIHAPTPRAMTIYSNMKKVEGSTDINESRVKLIAKGMSVGNNDILYVVDSDLGEIHHFYWQGIEYSPKI